MLCLQRSVRNWDSGKKVKVYPIKAIIIKYDDNLRMEHVEEIGKGETVLYN